MPIKQEQIDEWAEGEVTIHFLSILTDRLDATYKQRSETYFPYEAQKTQEVRAVLIGAEGELRDIIDAIVEKNLSQLEVEDEQVGNTPSLRPGVN